MAHLGAISGPSGGSWCYLGATWGHLGEILCYLGASWDYEGPTLGQLWGPRGPQITFKRHGKLRSRLHAVHILLKRPVFECPLLSVSVLPFRRSKMASHGVIFGHLGTFLGPSWGHLGASWGHLRTSWGLLGPSWGHLGAILGPSWLHLGAILGSGRTPTRKPPSGLRVRGVGGTGRRPEN